MKTAIITDSGANLSSDFIQKHPNLHVIPLMILVDGKSYRDQVEITAEEVYSKIDTNNITTSLPNMDDFTNVIEKLKKEDYTDVLVINISSGLSGTFNAFRLAIEDVKGINITQYDTKTLGSAEGYLVEEALELVKKKVAIKDIIKKLDQQRFENSIAIYTINTLKYLRKGGRIGKVEGTIGNILRIKPVITVNEEGVYITLSKAFGLQRSLLNMKELLVEKFTGHQIDLTIHYGDDPEKAKQLGDMLSKTLDVRNLSITPLTPVLGVHTGPELFAYIARIVK